MNGNYECHQTFNFELVRSAFTTCDDEAPSPSPQYDHINFNFLCKFKLSEWIRHQDSTEPQLARQPIDPPSVSNFFCLNLQQFLCYQERRVAIEKEIRKLPLENDVVLQQLIEFVLNQSWEIFKSRPCETGSRINVVHLDFDVTIDHIHVFDQRSAIIQQPVEESEFCMVPAAESSIGLLKKKVLDSGSVDQINNCSICLEDLECEALCMPCGHIYHGNCIKKWLRTSHYCPVCRFEMPTS